MSIDLMPAASATRALAAVDEVAAMLRRIADDTAALARRARSAAAAAHWDAPAARAFADRTDDLASRLGAADVAVADARASLVRARADIVLRAP